MENILTMMAFVTGAAAVGARVGYVMYGEFGCRKKIIITSAGLFGAFALLSAMME